MKNILLGSSALVGASLLVAVPVAAAEAPVLSFNGWTRVEVSGVDQDLTAGQGRGYQFEVDSHYLTWKAKGTADNGMTYGANISAANNAAGVLSVDEVKLTFGLANEWGTVIVGDDDGADDVMMIGGFSLQTAGYGHDGGYTSNVNRGGIGFTGAFTSLVGDTSDATKVSYYTPRLNGLQVGVSFTPDSGNTFSTGLGEDNDGDFNNHLGVGANFKRTFGDVGVQIGSSMAVASTEPNSTTVGAASSLARDDLSAWSIGGTLSFSGFSIGAGHGDSGDSNCTKANTLCDQGDWWDFGANYKMGNSKIAIGYMNNESNVAGSAVGDEVDVWSIGVNHDFASAPGLRAWAEVTSFSGDRTGTASDNDATYMMIGTQVAY